MSRVSVLRIWEEYNESITIASHGAIMSIVLQYFVKGCTMRLWATTTKRLACEVQLHKRESSCG